MFAMCRFFLLLNHRLRQPELICSTIQGVAYKVKVPATASGGSTGLQQRNRVDSIHGHNCLHNRG